MDLSKIKLLSKLPWGDSSIVPAAAEKKNRQKYISASSSGMIFGYTNAQVPNPSVAQRLFSWTHEIRPVPWSKPVRIVLAILIVLGIIGDSQRDDAVLTTPLGLLDFLVPFAPAVGLLVGPLTAAVVWFASMGIIVFIGPTNYLLAGTFIATMMVLFFVCALFPIRQGVAFFVAALMVMAILVGRGPQDSFALFYAGFLPGFAAVGAAGFAMHRLWDRIKVRDRQIDDLKDRQERVRREERQQIAYELHDIVAHDITIISMQARRAALLSDPEKKQQIFDSIGATASQTLQDLRSLLVVLKPPTDDDSVTVTSAAGDPVLNTPEVSGETTTTVGFLEDFNDVVEALQRSSLSVEKNIEGDTETIPMSQRQTLRRIVREMATNVLKHGASGSRVSLNLRVDPVFVVMSMENVISETEPIMSSQTGLEAIKARAEVFGGVVSSGSEDGTLWKTTVMLPLAGLDGGTSSFSLVQDDVGVKHPGEAHE